MGLYAPNQNKKKYWEDLRQQISTCDTKEVIMFGDFNVVMDNKIDHSRESTSPELSKSFILLVDTWDLVDI